MKRFPPPPFSPPGKALARLPSLTKRLPPSNVGANPRERVIVAFRSGTCWALREYRLDAVPKPAAELAEAIAAEGFSPIP